MRKNKWGIVAFLIILAVTGFFVAGKIFKGSAGKDAFREFSPVKGAIEMAISSTGTVLPKNRLQVLPPVSGRIENILVREGERVKTGQIIAWMSSTDRAALLDAARGKGEKALAYWKEVYKPIALVAPIDGEVIVATMQPGQTVSTADAVLVLSDQLIVKAQVDETDIGKVKIGQRAVITLDAYPGINVKAKVDHVSYESTVVNNVTIYQVDIIPEKVPDVFRSGMSANVKIIQASREDVLMVPLEAVKQKGEQGIVLVSQGPGQKPLKRTVELGLSDETNVEIKSGLALGEKVVERVAKYEMSKKSKAGTNPFMPAPGGGRRVH